MPVLADELASLANLAEPVQAAHVHPGECRRATPDEYDKLAVAALMALVIVQIRVVSILRL